MHAFLILTNPMMMQTRYNIQGIFLGTGTSQGVPVIGCECDVCKSFDTRDKRLRSAFFLDIEGVHFVIDAGPDFRQQIAESWNESIDDSMARNDWDWKPKFELEEMTKDMLRHLSN